MATERISQDTDSEGTIGERVAREIDEAVAARLAINPDLARVLDETREARDRAVRRIVADYLDELDRLAAHASRAEPERAGRFDGDGYSVRRLSPDEIRRAGLAAYEPAIAAHQDSTEEFLAFLDSRPAADDPAAPDDGRPITADANPR